ncbi:hypothetical protein F5X68DRAFT_145661 [Plectosphaerella plurivora]|uniref:Zn(2)-C6 fungal-type domain-containing protein n=1 Tax=Plectosphaerella plurivora TaxID=936078 RepID=A0A9P8V0A7_9PEZI|nr:hypothetical protein F5X68DRAFT_145661 [Plectosphaerella plurivora]
MASHPAIGACDNCKRRKVKCDTTSPCANCRTSQISCQYRAVPRKRGRPSKAALRVSTWDEQ